MADNSNFPPIPVSVPFAKDQIVHLFPVLQENSIGIVYGERWSIATLEANDVKLDVFPENEFSIPSAKALPQKDPDSLYVRTSKGVDLLDWKQKKQLASYMDISKSIEINVQISKIIDYNHGFAISVFEYFDKDEKDVFNFVIDDIINKKRLKEIPIPNFSSPFPVYFTPSYIIYRQNWKSPWQALDNNLNQTAHPLIDLLNKDTSDSVFAVINDNMLVSEELRHAFIATYSKAAKKDMLFLARWCGDPEVVPIPMDSSVTAGGCRLMKSPNNNTISPSGKWVYFSVDGGNNHKNTHYIIYLDPKLPQGFLPPFKLDFEGVVDLASWMTSPEGLVLYRNDQLLYYDLSHFDPNKIVQKTEN